MPAFARVNGIELCWDSFGDASAPPLLLIMGLAAQMIAWDDEFCARLTFVRIYQEAVGVTAEGAEAWVDRVERETGRYVSDVFA